MSLNERLTRLRETSDEDLVARFNRLRTMPSYYHGGPSQIKEIIGMTENEKEEFNNYLKNETCLKAQQMVYDPVTLSVPKEPVIASDGNTYDIETIIGLPEPKISPITRELLKDSIYPNLAAKQFILCHLEKYREKKSTKGGKRRTKHKKSKRKTKRTSRKRKYKRQTRKTKGAMGKRILAPDLYDRDKIKILQRRLAAMSQTNPSPYSFNPTSFASPRRHLPDYRPYQPISKTKSWFGRRRNMKGGLKKTRKRPGKH